MEDIILTFFIVLYFIRAELDLESGGAAGSSQTEDAAVQDLPAASFEVKQHIQTCDGRRLFSFRYEGGGEPSVGDLRKALKRQRYICVCF